MYGGDGKSFFKEIFLMAQHLEEVIIILDQNLQLFMLLVFKSMPVSSAGGT